MDAPPPPRIGYLISRLGLTGREQFAAALAPLGLRPPAYGALALLAQCEPASQQVLAEGLDVDRSFIVGVVDDLEARGAVERRRDPRDRRRYALCVTPTGRALLARSDAIADDLEEQRLAMLTDEQRTQLRALLTLVAARDRAHHDRPVGLGVAKSTSGSAARNAGPSTKP